MDDDQVSVKKITIMMMTIINKGTRFAHLKHNIDGMTT